MLKKEIWYHATTLENSLNILANNSFVLNKSRNGNFLGRGIYFCNNPKASYKYGEIILKCSINIDNILFSAIGEEITIAINSFNDLKIERGNYLKEYFLKRNYKGINYPYDKFLNQNRKLVIYDLDLITIEGVLHE